MILKQFELGLDRIEYFYPESKLLRTEIGVFGNKETKLLNQTAIFPQIHSKATAGRAAAFKDTSIQCGHWPPNTTCPYCQRQKLFNFIL